MPDSTMLIVSRLNDGDEYLHFTHKALAGVSSDHWFKFDKLRNDLAAQVEWIMIANGIAERVTAIDVVLKRETTQTLKIHYEPSL